MFRHLILTAAAGLLVQLWAPVTEAAGKYPQPLPVNEVLSVNQTVEANGDSVDIYYPDPDKSAQGYRWPMARGYRFPLVIYLQGALVDKKYYSQFAQELASYGFVVAVPNHANLFTEMSVITDTLAHMKSENTDIDSPLYGIVDTDKLALSGHSYGGLAALLAINNSCIFACDPAGGFERPEELKVVVVTASNAGMLDIQNTGIPTAIVVGDLDTGQENYQNTYDNLEAPRYLITVHGANHFGMADVSEPPGAQLDPDEPAQTIPQSITATRFAYWSGQFLRAYLHYDWASWWQVNGSGGDAFVTVTTD